MISTITVMVFKISLMICMRYTLRKKKGQKLSLGLYFFKRYTFVPKGLHFGTLMVHISTYNVHNSTYIYILASKMDKSLPFEKVQPQ